MLPVIVLVCVLVYRVMAIPLAGHVRVDKRAEEPNINFCFVNGRVYKHGEVFTVPEHTQCFKYKCEFAAHKILEDGCQSKNGNCYKVNASFEEECMTYTCTKKEMEPQTFHYQIHPVGYSKCEDYFGNCRSPGTRLYASAQVWVAISNNRQFRTHENKICTQRKIFRAHRKNIRRSVRSN